MMQNEITIKQLRSFGLTVGGIFALIGLWPLVVHNQGARWWSLIVAVVLILPALVYPKSLFWIHKGWMAVGHVLGWINTRIILGVLFYGLITPMAIVMRFMGRDPMRRAFEPDADTYRISPRPRPGAHMTRQF